MSDENINICINVVTKKSITEAGNKLDTLGKKGAAAGKKIAKGVKNSDKALADFKRTTAFAVTGLIALTVAAVKSINAFKQFENGLINVEKVTNISGKNLESFGKEIDRLATRLPIGTSELLNLSQTAGQLGISGANNILAFAESVAILTRTTDLTVESARSIAQLLAVSGTGPENIGRLSAVIVDLGNNFSATESQILAVSTRIAQSTTRFNLLAEDSVKLGAVIAAVGEKAEASGTAIGKTFRSLESAIVSGGAPLQRLTELTGLQQKELSKLFESNPTELLRKFTQGLGEASKQGKLIPNILAEFGLRTDRVNRVLGPLIKNTDKVNEAFRRTEIQMLNQNAATEEALKQFRSLESAEIRATSATEILAKTIGTQLEPAYRSILESILNLSIQTTRFIEDSLPRIKVFVGAIVGIGIALVGITIKLALGTAAASAFWTALLGPIGLAIAVLASVGAAVATIANNWEEVKADMDKVGLKILELKVAFLEFFSTTSFLQKENNKLQKENLKNTKEELRLTRERIKARDEEIRKTEEDIQKKEETKQKIRQLEDQQRDLNAVLLDRNTVDKKVIAATQRDIKLIDERIKKLRGLAEFTGTAQEIEDQKLKQLIARRTELENSIDSAGGASNRATEAELVDIQRRIDKIKELSTKTVAAAVDEVNELTKIKTEFNTKFEALDKVAQDKSVDGIREFLLKQKEERLKALRDQAIDLGDFQAARRVELEIDADEKVRIEREAAQKSADNIADIAKKKIEDIRALEQEQEDLENDKILIEKEIEIADTEQEKEDLRLLLEEKELLRLEALKKQLENEKNFLAASEIQRQINDKKEEKEDKLKTDSEIRRNRIKNNLKRLKEQTTSEQIIGIGDNLLKAGIIQGKTAGKVLKTLKTGEAIINTFAGANQALSSAPPPFNFILAASVIASGLANVASIQAQKFATGGIVQLPQNIQRGIDTVPAQLSVGEEVLTRNNPRHRDNISRETEDGGMIEELRGLRSDIQGMQTIVTIDGKEVADVIQEQRFRGVS